MSFPRYPEYKDSGVAWLGEVPAHWEITSLKRRYNVIGGSTPASGVPEFWDGGIVWVTPADLSRLGSFEIETSQRTITKSGLSSCGTTLVPPESIVLSTRAPIGSVGIAAVSLCTNQGCKALAPSVGQNSRFATYALSSATSDLNIRGKGTTFLELSGDELGAFIFPFPPNHEQKAIAAFLDRETGKIDALIAEQEKLIALLNEKRQALISHAVTKGLDPTVPMKDSGIEWLGQVPAHWRVLSLGRIAESKCDGPFGSGLKSEHYVDDGARVIRLQNIRGGTFDDRDAAFIDISYFKMDMQGHDVREDDVLVAGLGDDNNAVGRACVAPSGIYPAIVKADCFRFRLDRKQAYPQFVAWALTVGSRFDSGTLSSGSTRSRIPLSVTCTRKIPLPPIDEQRTIAASIERCEVEFSALIDLSERAIMLLKERRAALISAAVTGKIDVRETSSSINIVERLVMPESDDIEYDPQPSRRSLQRTSKR